MGTKLTKVVPVRLTPELAEAMRAHPEINWAEVARQCWAARVEREQRAEERRKRKAERDG